MRRRSRDGVSMVRLAGRTARRGDAWVFEARVADARAAVGGRGARGRSSTPSTAFTPAWRRRPHIRAFIEREPTIALPLMTSSEGQVHPRIVELIQDLIEAEVERGGDQPPTDSNTLAYVPCAAVRGAALQLRRRRHPPSNSARLRETLAALLGA